MSKYDSLLTQQQKQILNNAIASLEKALENGKANLPSGEGQDVVTQLPVFDPAVAQEAMDNLIQLYKDIFSSIGDGGNGDVKPEEPQDQPQDQPQNQPQNQLNQYNGS